MVVEEAHRGVFHLDLVVVVRRMGMVGEVAYLVGTYPEAAVHLVSSMVEFDLGGEEFGWVVIVEVIYLVATVVDSVEVSVVEVVVFVAVPVVGLVVSVVAVVVVVVAQMVVVVAQGIRKLSHSWVALRSQKNLVSLDLVPFCLTMT